MAKNTQDKIKGKAQEWAGEAREEIGELTGSEEQQAKRKMEKGKGKAKQVKGEIEKKIKKAA
jgi:uncharacterized protein YjbJ (UPF0337 family)